MILERRFPARHENRVRVIVISLVSYRSAEIQVLDALCSVVRKSLASCNNQTSCVWNGTQWLRIAGQIVCLMVSPEDMKFAYRRERLNARTAFSPEKFPIHTISENYYTHNCAIATK